MKIDRLILMHFDKKVWAVFFIFYSFYSLNLPDNIDIYLSVVIIFDSFAKYIAVTAHFFAV